MAHTYASKIKKGVVKRVKTISKPIDDNSVSAILKIYELFLVETRYPNFKPIIIGLDGTRYHFHVNSDNFARMYGETWSPPEGSQLDIIVQASILLRNYLLNKITEEELSQQIVTLNKNLKKYYK